MRTRKFKSTLRSSAFLLLFLFVLGAVSFAFPDVVLQVGKKIGLSAPTVTAQSTPEALKKSPPKQIKTSENPLGTAHGRLIFGRTAHTPQMDGQIGSIDAAAGSTPTPLTGEHEFEPAWSPDGKKIVFISMRDGIDTDWYPEERTNREIYIMNSDGTDQRRLTFNALPEVQPVFSPDGTKIIYVGMVDGDVFGDSGVFSMNLDGSNQTLLFNENCIPAGQVKSEKKKPGDLRDNYYPGVIGIDTPNYSPDMSNIIFSTGFGASRGVYRYNVAAGTCSLVVQSGNNSIEPRYSPDGTKIAINGNTFFLDILDSNGNFLYGFNPPGYDGYSTPTWSPDSTKIAYLATFGNWGPKEIRVFDLTTQASEIVYAGAEPYFFNGLSWGNPTTLVPPITLAISPNYSVAGGQTVQGTIQMNPATFPAGGGTVNLSIAGEAGILSLPQTSVTIPAGSTSAVFDINTIPYALLLNNYKSADVIAEYAGDQARATVSVRPQRPDLRVTTATAPSPFVLGAATNVSWTIENIGDAPTQSTFTDSIYFSTDDQFNTSDTFISSQSNAILGAGQTRTNNRSITLPHSLNPQNQQNYLIFYTNRNVGQVDEDGNYANNWYAVPIDILLPDVTAENLVVPAQIEPGVNFTVSYTIRNSNAPTGTGFQSRLYYSEDQIIGNGDDVVIFLNNHSAMTAGQTATVSDPTNSVSTVPVRPDGQWLIYARVDSTNALSEGAAGEANNIVSQAVPFFYRVPDLQVASVTPPAEVTSQTPFTIQWTDTNAGARAAGTFTDRVFFSLDNQVGGDTQIGTSSLTGGIAANTSTNRSLSVTIPTTAISQTGDYYVYVQTDATTLIDEGTNENNNIRFQPVRVLRNSPDVVAENLVAPAQIEPGVNYNFSYTVRNAGAATTAVSFNNRLYFSYNQTVGDADDFLIDSVTQAAMAGAQTVTRNVNNAQIPTLPVSPDSQGLVYVKVDFANAVNEGTGGETNNTAQQTAQFFYRVPDLQVTATSAPAEVDSDAAFALSWTDLNAGNRNAAAFTDKVYFSLDNQVGADVEIGSFALAAGLNAGASANRIQNVTIPTGALTQTGNYFIYVKTDGAGAIDEGANENNNVRFQPVRVRRLLRPDLTITNITAPNAAFFDQTIQVQWTVTNSGQGPTNAPQWKDKVFLHTAQSNSASHLVAVAQSVSALNAGESYVAQATFKIPRGFNGTYIFTVKTDTDATLNEENTANNVLTRPIQINVPPLPDLIVESVQVPLPEAFAGQELSVGYTIKNQGTANAFSWRDRVYLSRDTTLDTNQDRLIFTTDGYESATIGANQTRTMTTRNRIAGTFNPVQYTTMRLPSDAEGLWYVFIVTDYNDGVYEFTNENNNTGYDSVQPGAPLNILVTPPDLVVPNQPTAPDNAMGGQNIQIGFTVKNQGAFNAAPFLYHAVYLSTDQTFDSGDTLLSSIRDEDPFPPAAEHPLTMNVSLPNCLADGNYYLFAVADFDKRQFEFDPGFDAEANNASPAKQIQITTLPPDLRVTNLQIPAISQPGQNVAVNWTVSNTGSGAASGAWNDRVALHSTNPQIPAQTLLNVEHAGGLAAAASYTQTRNVALPAYMEGEYYLSVTTDHNKAVSECGAAENNNAANSSNFNVQNNLPDLVIDAVGAPSTAVVGDSFNVAWTGRNSNAAMPANAQTWSDSVYLSTDQTLSTGDRLLGSGINPLILAGGQTYQKQLPVSTGNIAPGNYYILVKADSGGNVYEGASNTAPETNNVRASAPLTLTSPSVDLQVGNVSAAPPFYSGTDLSISWTVTNFGATPTLGTNWSDYVILSRDAIIDPNDTILGYRARAAVLAGGANYTASGSFPVPSGLTGDYNIFVITDYKNQIIESDNSNNTSPPFALDLILPPPADLNITNVAPPASVNLGEAANFNWTVQNSGANAVLGKWRDTVYLSRDTFWDSSDILVGQRELESATTNVPPGGTYTTGTGVVLTSVEEGTYYVIVRTDAQNRIRETNEADNVSAAAVVTTVTITELALNTPLSTTLENGGQKFYKFTPSPAETILLSLTSNTPQRENELLTNFGSIVSRADYDFQGSRPGEANQENFIPETQEGKYYSLVRTDLIPTSFADKFDKAPVKAKENDGIGPIPAQNITVNAQILPFTVRGVTPEEAGNSGVATLVVQGAKFQTGATLRLVGANGAEIAPAKSKVVRSTEILAIFDLKGKAAGAYDIVVTNPNNQTSTLDDGFTIRSGGGATEPRVSIVGPSFSRGGRNRYTFSFTNDGLNDLLNVPLIITMPSNYNYQLDESNYIGNVADFLPPGANPAQIPLSVEHEGTRVIMLFTPVLRSKRSVKVGLDITLPFGFARFEVSAFTLPPLEEWYDLAVTGQAAAEEELLRRAQQSQQAQPTAAPDCTQADLKVKRCLIELVRQTMFAVLIELLPTDCLGVAWRGVAGLGDLVFGMLAKGSDVGAYDVIGGLGNLIASTLGNMSSTTGCLAELAPWLQTLSAIVTIGQLVYNLWDCFRQYECEPPTTHSTSFPSSFDPNEKISPEGYGAERFVPVGQPLLYRINFENLASATAPAQTVRIIDNLPAALDARTVRLKEIGFKQTRIVLPDNQAFYQSRIQLGADLNNLKADITAGLDLINNRIFWTLQAIDPQTGEPPVDPFAGLLPPNNAERDGEGYVIFTIEAKQTFPNRTAINNLATIIFDQNEPIITNTTANLLDSVVPTSQIDALPATSATPSFNLSWTGTDDTDGSGFSGYDIFYSEDGKPYLPFLNGTLDTNAVFTAGQWGKTYRFYSIARDNAGNIEPPPDVPDATIQILGGNTEGDVAPRPNGNDGQVSVGDVTQIRRFAAALDADFQTNEFQRADIAPRESSGNGGLSTADVVQARRFAAGLDQPGAAAGPNEATALNAKTIGGKNSLALPRELRPVRVTRTGSKVTVGIELEAQGDEVGVGFTLNFDPSVLSNPANVALGSGAGGAALTVNNSQAAAGRLGIIIDRAPTDPFPAGVRQLVTVEFDIAPSNPSSATLGFGNSPVLSEVVDGSANTLTTVFSSRTIALTLVPTAANVSVSGQVLSANGERINRAIVKITDQSGNSRTASTNSFGNFRFDGLPSGQIYTVGVSAKGFDFNTEVLNVTDNVVGLILRANPE